MNEMEGRSSKDQQLNDDAPVSFEETDDSCHLHAGKLHRLNYHEFSFFGFEKAATLDAGLNARRAPAEQGSLPWRQEVAPLDAGFGFRTRGRQTRGITVTGDHGVPISLPARIRT